MSGGLSLATNDPNPTKVDETKPAEDSEENLLSLDSLDNILKEADPEFAKSLEEIGPDEAAAVIYEEGLELEYTLADEQKLWDASTGKKKFFLKVLPFLPRISYRIKMILTVLRLQRVKLKANLRNAGPLTAAWMKNRLLKLKLGLGDLVSSFQAFSTAKKLLFFALVLATGASGFLIYRISTKGLIPASENLFLSSLEDWALNKYSWDPETQGEAFYDSLRASQSIFVMQKMVVNLRRSASSGPNPMGAFEFYVEGAATEVVIEIKDREPEMRDLFQRTIEETTFDQVSSGEGKQQLTERLRKDVNKVLTKGKVRRIFIKTAIIKP